MKKHDGHVIEQPVDLHHDGGHHHEAAPHIIATVVPNPISIKESIFVTLPLADIF